ncbi:MAG: adenine nucleotide alpha hydrolase [Thiotrichales bacterium]|nr:adenine nucleotide alpha hydrolase [Thiotrichales bacterium]
MTKPRVMLSWSSGKDSAWSLHTILQSNDYEVVGIFTTVNAEFQRVAMHGVRLALLKQQAEAMGLPLTVIEIPWPCSNQDYESAFAHFISHVNKNVEGFIFGDLFLDDIRQYRVSQLDGTGIKPVFPLWLIPTDELAQTMVSGGLKAIISCVDPKQCPKEFAGREYNMELLADLPSSVDPCGENGEFHTFVFDAPIYSKAIDIRVGEIIERNGFIFADIVPFGDI